MSDSYLFGGDRFDDAAAHLKRNQFLWSAGAVGVLVLSSLILAEINKKGCGSKGDLVHVLLYVIVGLSGLGTLGALVAFARKLSQKGRQA